MTTKSKTQDKHKMSEIDENISKLFDIKKRLGKGAYGIVWKALDKRTNETLAVKKIFDAFRDETDAQRTFREIIFLKAFRNHTNVIKLHNVYKASNNLDIYLIFEYMESDLHNIIKKGTILKDIHKRYVIYQLVNAIKYIHSGNVIHRDLKPSNVLIDSKCRCKLADFGLARSVANRPMRDANDMGSDPVIEPLLTDYVATRWYRAPEILVASKRYTKGIDMWSLGCILGEMIRGKPLFQGSSTVNQIEKIVTALPDITDHDINAVGAGFGSVLLSKQIATERKTSLDELLFDAPGDAIGLVKSLLVLDPLSRLTAKQALCHPYVEKFRNSIPEIELHVDVLPPFRDDVRLTVPEYRSKLYEIVQTAGEKPNNNINNTNMNNTRSLGSGKNMINNKQRELKKESMNYEKNDVLSRKSSKSKQQQTHNFDNTVQYITKEQYLDRNERYNKDADLIHHNNNNNNNNNNSSINNNNNNAFNTQKKQISPGAKRKSIKIPKSHNDTREIITQAIDKLNAAAAIVGASSKSKSRSKRMEPMAEAAHKMHPFDKRHSIDGVQLPHKPQQSSPTTLQQQSQQQPQQHLSCGGMNLIKMDSAQRLYKSSSALIKTDYTTPHARSYTPHKEAVIAAATLPVPLKQKERYNRSTPTVSVNENKASYVRTTKSDVTATKQQQQQQQQQQHHERICYEKRLKKLEEEIEKYKKEVKSFCKESHSSNNSSGDVGNAQNKTALAPPMSKLKHSSVAKLINLPINMNLNGGGAAVNNITTHTPKKNPYYQLLAKGNREFGRNAEYELSCAGIGTGGSGDHIGRSAGGLEEQRALKHEQHNHHHHEQQHQHLQQQQQHRVRPVAKFI